MSGFFAKVAVENTAYDFDKEFDYLIPRELLSRVRPGCRVLVPFGAGNRRRQGMIFEITSDIDSAIPLKPISELLDGEPLLTDELLQLARFIKDRCFCPLFEAVKLLLPVGINIRVSHAFSLNPLFQQEKAEGLSLEEKQIIAFLHRKRLPVERRKLLSALGLEEKVDFPEKLVCKGILLESDSTVRRVGDATLRMVRPLAGQDLSGIKLSEKQREVYDLLCAVQNASVKELCYFTGVTGAVVDAVVKKGLAEYYNSEFYRIPYPETAALHTEEITLTGEQQKAYESLLAKWKQEDPGTALLYGVTGSGKTSVFLKLIDEIYRAGKDIIVMVPEIALTPQVISLFRGRYGSTVAVFHSGLSLGERMDEWKRVRSGKVRIAVGTRSAVTAPFRNLGLIVMDEEQEYSYKSESSPRYHAREAAKFRCYYHKAMLLLCSATPSVESFYYAKTGRYSLNVLNSRYGKALLPEVSVVDMNEEAAQGAASAFSESLTEALRENLKTGQQSILLLNRRGYHTFVSCRACGEVLCCPHCSISMTYHSANGRLMCHYCGYSAPFAEECPSCHERKMRYSGSGTQRAEEELAELFPQARILRMDADVTLSKFAYEKKLRSFAEGAYDIMVGTQMVAKGLNFPSVTLVGVLSADQALYGEDFRSYERAFSLLTQVVGRSGRGNLAGKAIVQTFTPENPIIRMAARQDYEAFFESEISLRKTMLYPPFSDIGVIGFIGEEEEKTLQAAELFFKRLRVLMREQYKEIPLRVLGPSAAAVAKVSNRYRYKLILKYRNSARFREMLSRLLSSTGRERTFSGISVYADMNPELIL